MVVRPGWTQILSDQLRFIRVGSAACAGRKRHNGSAASMY